MSAVYFVRIASKVYGPLDADQLKRLAAAGKLTRDDAISKDGKTGWTPAGAVKGLFPPAELLPAAMPIETVVAPAIPVAVSAPPPLPAPAVQPTIVYVQAPAAPPSQQVIQQTTLVVNPGTPGNTCATLAAGLGLLSLIAAFVPVLGLIALPGAALTLVLALFGFIVAITRRGTGLVGSIGGGLLALVAIPIALASTTAAVTGAVEAAKQSERPAPVTSAEEPGGK